MARGNGQISKAVSAGAPTRGIDDTSPLANMEEGFCVSMRNWYPGAAALELRSGYAEWVTGLDSAAVRLFNYYSMDGAQKLFASTQLGIYDVTVPTATPTLVYNFSSGAVYTTHFANTGGQYLVVAATNSDPVAYYNGSAWGSFSNIAPPPEGEFAGIGEIYGYGADVTAWIYVTAYKRRLWFVESGTMTAWYLGTDALGGEATPFYLGSIFQRGGYLVGIETWSLDSGSGMDDMIIFRSSTGEIAIYQGDNPDDFETWTLVSVYFVSAPVGKSGTTDLGGDIIMLTRAGLIPLSKVVQGVATESLYESAISKNISNTLNALVLRASSAADLQWELFNIPMLQALMVVIPPSANLAAVQFLMNTVTGAWTSYDLPATCLGTLGGAAYFGTADGRVMVMTSGRKYLDGVKLDGTGGVAINATFLSSYSYLGDPTSLKHFKLVRPIFQSTTEPSVQLGISTDYQLEDVDTWSTPVVGVGALSEWDVAQWDNDTWVGTNTVFRPWSGVTGLGFAAALRANVTNTTYTSSVAYEVVYETGGVV